PLTDDPSTSGTVEIAFEDTLTINLGGLVKAVDGDGDTVSLSNGLSIVIRDDIPYLDSVSSATVTQLDTLTTGSFNFHVGADEPGHLSVTPPTIEGVTVTNVTDPQSGVVTVTGKFANGDTYYVLTVNPNGTYTFEIDNLPTSAHTLGDVALTGAYAPVAQKDFGPFTFITDPGHTVNGSVQGTGIDNDGLGNGEHVTIQCDHAMTLADLHFKQTGSGDVTVNWVATDSATGHQETGSFVVPQSENGSGVYTVDISQANLTGDIPHFDKLELTASSASSGQLKMQSLGGTQLIENPNVGPFDFTLTGTDFDGDAAAGTIHVDVDINSAPTGAGSMALTVDEAALDLTQDLAPAPADLHGGVVTGTNPSSRNETAEGNSGITFTATGEAITVDFADPAGAGWVAPSVSGLAAGYHVDWRFSGGELIGNVVLDAGNQNQGDAIFLKVAGGTSANPGDSGSPTIHVTITHPFPHQTRQRTTHTP